jgi:hypothetical protein
MTPDEAIQKMVAAGLEKTAECLYGGVQLTVNLIDEQGEVCCPKCGRFTTHERNQF